MFLPNSQYRAIVLSSIHSGPPSSFSKTRRKREQRKRQKETFAPMLPSPRRKNRTTKIQIRECEFLAEELAFPRLFLSPLLPPSLSSSLLALSLCFSPLSVGLFAGKGAYERVRRARMCVDRNTSDRRRPKGSTLRRPASSKLACHDGITGQVPVKTQAGETPLAVSVSFFLFLSFLSHFLIIIQRAIRYACELLLSLSLARNLLNARTTK